MEKKRMFKWFAEKSGVMSCVCMVFALIGMTVLAFVPSIPAALAMSITYVVVGFAGIGLVTGAFYLAERRLLYVCMCGSSFLV